LRRNDYNLDEDRKKLEAERIAYRKGAIGEDSPEQRGWFQTIMKLAQDSAWFSEEHNHYLDLYAHAMVRRSVMGVGTRFAKVGAIDTRDDILFLIPEEVRRACINPDMFKPPPSRGAKKADWKQWCAQPPVPAFMKEALLSKTRWED